MHKDQVIVGTLVVMLCVAGLVKDRWILTQSRYGKFLARKFGETQGLWILRTLLAAMALFGVLLATDVIRPIRWN